MFPEQRVNFEGDSQVEGAEDWHRGAGVVSASMSLRAFLEDPARPTGTLRYHELQGFLFAIASAPQLIRPSEWMPLVFGDVEPEYASLDEAKRLLGELMSLYNSVNASVSSERATLPADCTFHDDVLANLDDDSPISQWSRGFMHGHRWLEDLWDAYVPDELDDSFAAKLLALSFFASRDIAEAFQKETAADQSLDALAATIRLVFPNALAEYAHFGRSIAQVLAESQTAERAPHGRQKTGRNDPCPCGSGRKYKKCCGVNTH
jgi:uncharacterized protein